MAHGHVKSDCRGARALFIAGALAGLAGTSAWAQPTPAPTTGDLLCKSSAAVNVNDTVVSIPDGSGFYSLFNGKDFKGWYNNCETGHSGGDRVNGAIWRIGTVGTSKAIYSTQRGTTGSILMTNKLFRNYEIRFQYWSDFQNDAGVFNRTTNNGRCYQTTLDYIQGAALGGVWGEGGFTGRDFRPFSFTGNEQTIAIPGNNQGEMSNWTAITKKIKATSQTNLPCPVDGCTQTEWRALWDMDGWNDIRIQFYGGTAADKVVRMKSWFKKPSNGIWIPLIQDVTLQQVIPDGRIGLQVHGGGRFSGPKGTWYRKIRWKKLTDQGAVASQSAPPPLEATGVNETVSETPFVVDARAVSGYADQDYVLTVSDLQGRHLETFQGGAGPFTHAFRTEARGLLVFQVKAGATANSYRVVRPY